MGLFPVWPGSGLHPQKVLVASQVSVRRYPGEFKLQIQNGGRIFFTVTGIQNIIVKDPDAAVADQRDGQGLYPFEHLPPESWARPG